MVTFLFSSHSLALAASDCAADTKEVSVVCVCLCEIVEFSACIEKGGDGVPPTACSGNPIIDGVGWLYLCHCYGLFSKGSAIEFRNPKTLHSNHKNIQYSSHP